MMQIAIVYSGNFKVSETMLLYFVTFFVFGKTAVSFNAKIRLSVTGAKRKAILESLNFTFAGTANGKVEFS